MSFLYVVYCCQSLSYSNRQYLRSNFQYYLKKKFIWVWQKKDLPYFPVTLTISTFYMLLFCNQNTFFTFLIRKLRCPRNFVHINLFFAFGLRTILVMLVDSILNTKSPKFLTIEPNITNSAELYQKVDKSVSYYGRLVFF